MSSGGKFSFLDGVPFAINPIFLTGASTKVCHFESYPLQALIIYDNHSTFKTIKDPEYDLADSYTMLNYKVSFQFFDYTRSSSSFQDLPQGSRMLQDSSIHGIDSLYPF